MHKLIIWTRPLDSWKEDRILLASRNLLNRTLHVPCITTAPLNFILPKRHPDFIVVTSARTIHYLAQREDARQWLMQQACIVAFGERTKDALKQLPINAKQLYDFPKARHGEELAEQLTADQRFGSGKGRLHTGLHLSAQNPAFSISTYLTNKGLPTQHLAIYQTSEQPSQSHAQDHDTLTQLSQITPSSLAALLPTMQSSAVVLASPSAVRGFYHWISTPQPSLSKSFPVSAAPEILPRLKAFCIGSTTTRAAKQYFEDVYTSSDVSVGSLIDLLD